GSKQYRRTARGEPYRALLSVEGVIEADSHRIDGEIVLLDDHRRGGRVVCSGTQHAEMAGIEGLRDRVQMQIFELDRPGAGECPFDAGAGDPPRPDVVMADDGAALK